MNFLDFMIAKAKSKHGEIEPCIKNKNWENSITIAKLPQKNMLMFWYNSLDGSTHCISISLNELANIEINEDFYTNN